MASKGGGRKFDAEKYSFQTLNPMPSDGPDYPRPRPRRRDIKQKKCGKWTIFIMIGVGLLLLGLGVIIGYFSREVEFKNCYQNSIPVSLQWNSHSIKYEDLQSKVPNLIAEEIHNPQSILNQILVSGSWQDDNASQIIYDIFKDLGFDNYEKTSYKALLSFPKEDNVIRIIGENESVLYTTRGRVNSKKGHKIMKREQAPYHAYIAYSKAGVAQGEVVYINHGTPEDYEQLNKKNISVTGKIGLIRVGQISVQAKLDIALRYNLTAVLLYDDPSLVEYTGNDDEASFLSLYVAGEPDTLGISSQINPANSNLKMIINHFPIAQTISRRDARAILSMFANENAAPLTWVGSLNISYFMGKADHTGWTVRVKVTNELQEHDIHSVCGTIIGKSEPDRYVVLGTNRNSFNLNALEVNAPMLTIAEQLSLLKKNNLFPERTIKVCSWGGAEFGNIGFAKWIETHRQELFHKAVSYIHLGSTTSSALHLGISPGWKSLMQNLTHEIKAFYESKKISQYHPIKEIYKIMKIYPSKDTSLVILNQIGIPTISIKAFSDPHSNFSLLAHAGGAVLFNLAHTDILPFDIHDYGHFIYIKIKESCKAYPEYIDDALKGKLLDLAEELLKTIEDKIRKMYERQGQLSILEKESLNDELVTFEKAFLDQSGNNYKWRHLLSGVADQIGFPTLIEAVTDLFSDKRAKFHEQISLIIYAMQSALNTLKFSNF